MTTRIFGCLLSAMFFAATAHAATVPITVTTYNTDHGGKLNGTTGQLNMIAAQNPDVVVLQEASYSQLSTYVNGLNSRMGTDAWHGVYARLCTVGSATACTTWNSIATIVLTRLKTLSSSSILIWAKDDYDAARPAVQMTVELADGTPVTIIGVHLPALSDAETSRVAFVNALRSWASGFAGPRLIGGDFNASTGSTSQNAMRSEYRDVWSAVGSGPGYTHSSNGTTLTSRLDYWFADASGAATAVSAHTAGSLADSDHISLTATYNITPSVKDVMPPTPAPPTGETVLMTDSFATFNKTVWPYGVFTGSQDTTIPLAAGGGFHIGALKGGVTGSHYNGVSSMTYDLTNNGSVSAQLLQPANMASTAYAMFAAGSDGDNFYRWYTSGGALVAERKIAGTKTTLVDLPYDPTADQFLRIRREYDSATGSTDVVFETAPNNAGVAGSYTVRYREAWNAHVVASAMKVELKAGTSVAEVDPSTVIWSSVRVATNSK
jgi:endonuclease/exonuclease/phosphatase family metal-dependent hydrolase